MPVEGNLRGAASNFFSPDQRDPCGPKNSNQRYQSPATLLGKSREISYPNLAGSEPWALLNLGIACESTRRWPRFVDCCGELSSSASSRFALPTPGISLRRC